MMKKQTKRKRGLLANGPEIKKRRDLTGLSQQALVDSKYDLVRVPKRNLQRAEKGERLDQKSLQNIANLFEKTTVSDISLSDKDDPTSVPKGNLSLERLDPPSGQYVFNLLYQGVDGLGIDFNLDPNEEQSKTLAELFELLELIRASGNLSPWNDDLEGLSGKEAILTPSHKITAVGRLNGLLQSLMNDGIFLFYGIYTQWSGYQTFEYNGPRGSLAVPTTKATSRCEMFMSSSKGSNHLIKIHSNNREASEKVVIKEALIQKIHPDDFNMPNGDFSLDDDLPEICIEYRKMFIENFGEEATAPDAPWPPEDLIPF